MRRRSFLFLGLSCLFLSLIFSTSSLWISGSVIGFPSKSPESSILSIFFLLIAIALFVSGRYFGERYKVTSAIGEKDERGHYKFPHLVRLAQEAGENENVQHDLDHLIEQLIKGNTEAGLGTKHVDGTPISYLRGNRGGRLFYMQLGQNRFEIVAKSSKANEQKVIDEIRAEYRRQKR